MFGVIVVIGVCDDKDYNEKEEEKENNYGDDDGIDDDGDVDCDGDYDDHDEEEEEKRRRMNIWMIIRRLIMIMMMMIILMMMNLFLHFQFLSFRKDTSFESYLASMALRTNFFSFQKALLYAKNLTGYPCALQPNSATER